MWNNVSNITTIDCTTDYAVDNNSLLWGTRVNGLAVHKPDKLLSETKESVVVIVLSVKYYADIKKQLEEYGFIENVHFFCGQMLLGKVRGYF